MLPKSSHQNNVHWGPWGPQKIICKWDWTQSSPFQGRRHQDRLKKRAKSQKPKISEWIGNGPKNRKLPKLGKIAKKVAKSQESEMAQRFHFLTVVFLFLSDWTCWKKTWALRQETETASKWNVAGSQPTPTSTTNRDPQETDQMVSCSTKPCESTEV